MIINLSLIFLPALAGAGVFILVTWLLIRFMRRLLVLRRYSRGTARYDPKIDPPADKDDVEHPSDHARSKVQPPGK